VGCNANIRRISVCVCIYIYSLDILQLLLLALWIGRIKEREKKVRFSPHNVSIIICVYIYKELQSKKKITVLTIVTKLRTGQLRNGGSVWFVAGPRGFWLLQNTQTRSGAIHRSVEWFRE